MASVVCTCGESLILNAVGLTSCWFCQKDYDYSGHDVPPFNYEPQQSRSIIKSETVPFQSAERRGSWRRID